MKTFYVHTDSQHGWLAVKRQYLRSLGLIKKVTPYSYERGETVYLEEDCDASMFLNELKLRGIEYQFKEGKWVNYSPIRSYERFAVRANEVRDA